MNMTRRHQNDTKTFEELTFAEQAKAINIRVVGLKRCITAHLRRAAKEGRDLEMIRIRRVNQIRRLIDQL